jgi:cytoskeletal protein CcmA (bactofilin family)
MARNDPRTSVVGRATRLTGRIEGEGSLRIDGGVRGGVAIDGQLEIADGGSVEGDVSGESIDVGGTLAGDATAQGVIAVRSGATVRGTLRGARVVIEPGSRVAVRIDTDFELDLPSGRRRR